MLVCPFAKPNQPCPSKTMFWRALLLNLGLLLEMQSFSMNVTTFPKASGKQKTFSFYTLLNVLATLYFHMPTKAWVLGEGLPTFLTKHNASLHYKCSYDYKDLRNGNMPSTYCTLNFSLVWNCLCWWRLEGLLKAVTQSLHLYGFSPVWIFLWIVSTEDLLKSFPPIQKASFPNKFSYVQWALRIS